MKSLQVNSDKENLTLAGVGSLNEFSAGSAWMGSKIIPIAEASIPVTDWGLTRSDITYDVVPVRNGAFFRLDDYVERFFASMEKLLLNPEMTRQRVKSALHNMVAVTQLRDSYVSMVCSRGRPSIPGSRDPRDCKNYFYAWCVPFIYVIKPEIAQKGATALISTSAYRISESSVDPTVKNYHWGDFNKSLLEAKSKNFETAFLLDEKENITEGPGFNIFAVKDDTVLTPSKGVLQGITRKTVIEIAKYMNLKTDMREISKTEFFQTDEVFIATSAGGVTPVIKVNDRIFSNGKIGATTKRIAAKYLDWISKPKFRTEIDYSLTIPS